jgi:hypothetical protein
MDYVDWCAVVLQRLTEAAKASDIAQQIGFHHDRAAQVLFGEAQVTQPGFEQTTASQALLQALTTLEQLGILDRRHQRFWYISRTGQVRAQALPQRWKEMSQIDLTSEEERLLQVVNRLSQRTAADYAWLEEIPQQTLLAKLNWETGEEHLRQVAKGLEELEFVADSPFISRGLKLRATYNGLVWEQQHNEHCAEQPTFGEALQQSDASKYKATIGSSVQGFVQGDHTQVTMNMGLDEFHIRKLMEADKAFTEAEKEPFWQQAESLVRKGLQLDPQREGARSSFGIRLSQEIISAFQEQLFAAADSYYALTQHDRLTAMSPPPPEKAVEWLHAALDKHENTDGGVSLALALMNGLMGHYEVMLVAIRDALTLSEGARAALQHPIHLVMLALACGGKRARLETLGTTLALTLPVSMNQIHASYAAIGTTHREEVANWYAIEQAEPGQARSPDPLIIRLFRTSADDINFPTYCSLITLHGQAGGKYPPEDQYLPIDALLGKLMHRFFFVCPVNPNYRLK